MFLIKVLQICYASIASDFENIVSMKIAATKLTVVTYFLDGYQNAMYFKYNQTFFSNTSLHLTFQEKYWYLNFLNSVATFQLLLKKKKMWITPENMSISFEFQFNGSSTIMSKNTCLIYITLICYISNGIIQNNIH